MFGTSREVRIVFSSSGPPSPAALISRERKRYNINSKHKRPCCRQNPSSFSQSLFTKKSCRGIVCLNANNFWINHHSSIPKIQYQAKQCQRCSNIATVLRKSIPGFNFSLYDRCRHFTDNTKLALCIFLQTFSVTPNILHILWFFLHQVHGLI